VRAASDSFGIYVHIPFCAQRCDYCAFVTYVGVDDLHERYVNAVLRELGVHQEKGLVRPASSIYFGGGTPSRLSLELLGAILGALPQAPVCEITVEINPEDASDEFLAGLVAMGVNRFSVGIQSTAAHVLKELGRVHRGDDVTTLAKRIHDSGVASWSMDLIIGAKSERDEDLLATLESLVGHEHQPPHVSCYLLSVEKGTPLSADPTRHPDDDVLAHRYELLDGYLAEHGYAWYELSNWSQPGHESRHNQLYWSQTPYLGLGVGAHSAEGPRRWWNIANLTTYLERIEHNESVLGGQEVLDDSTRSFEKLALGLRRRGGLVWPQEVDLTKLAGYVVESEDGLVLTRSGRLIANEITHQLDALVGPSTKRAGSDH